MSTAKETEVVRLKLAAYATKNDYVRAAMTRTIDLLQKRGKLHSHDAVAARKRFVGEIGIPFTVSHKMNSQSENSSNIVE